VPAQLTLYGRPGCHLCERMLAELAGLRARFDFEVREVDIGADPALLARYAADIPVLAAADVELCRHFLDAVAVRAHLGKFR
jgi:glutathione S-transferase